VTRNGFVGQLDPKDRRASIELQRGTLSGVWTTPTLVNGWLTWTYDTAFQVPQYRRVGDTVFFRGLMRSGTVGSAAFVLPVGFRPLKKHVLSTVTYGGSGSTIVPGRIDVDSDGNVVPVNAATGGFGWISLSGLQFSVS
jgi:hypothetical protein